MPGFENQHNGDCHKFPCADELHSHSHWIFSVLTQVHPSERVGRSGTSVTRGNLGDLNILQ